MLEDDIAERIRLETARTQALDAGQIAPVGQLDLHSRGRTLHDERARPLFALMQQAVREHLRPEQNCEGVVLPESRVLGNQSIEHDERFSSEDSVVTDGVVAGSGVGGNRLRNHT